MKTADSLAQLSDLLVRLGGLLLRFGCPTQRLEACLDAVATAHGVHAEVFAVPTGLWTSVGEVGSAPHMRLTRVLDWTVDLQRLAALDEVFNAVAAHEISVADALVQLDQIEVGPPPPPVWMQYTAGAAASGAAAMVFGGGWREVLVGALAGLLVTILVGALGKARRTRLLADFFTGLLVGGCTCVATALDPGIARQPLILAGVIVAVPGLTLTAALRELAEKNLVSGTARCMDAGAVLVALVFGLAVALGVERWLGWTPATVVPSHPPSLWALGMFTLVAVSAFLVIFRVPRQDWLWTVGGGCVAIGGTAMAEHILEPGPLAAFVGALALGLYANSLARILDRPAQIYLLPGIVLLVPGAFSFASFEQVLRGDVTGGTAGFFTALLTAGALVFGLLMSVAALPPRKIL